MTTTLDRLRPGKGGIIVRVNGEGDLRRRMMEMGLVPGADVAIGHVGPFGGPMAIRTRGYHLAMRKSEARTIEVEVK